MTIMDQILEIEDKIQHMKESSQQEINSIIDESRKKYQEMQDTFAHNFLEESKVLESEMLDRVALYEQELGKSDYDIKGQLEASLSNKKEKLIQKICSTFWLE